MKKNKKKEKSILSLFEFLAFMILFFIIWYFLTIKFPILSVVMIELVLVIVVSLVMTIPYIKNEKKSYRIAGIISLIGLTLICFYIVITAPLMFNDEAFVKVLNVHNNKIVIDYTNYNYDDYKTYEIDKPFYAIVSENDDILVQYPKDHPEKMQYVINPIIMIIMLGFGIILMCIKYIFSSVKIIKSIINYFRKKEKKRGKL